MVDQVKSGVKYKKLQEKKIEKKRKGLLRTHVYKNSYITKLLFKIKPKKKLN